MNEILKCVKTSTACSFYICDVFPVFYILCDICLATLILLLSYLSLVVLFVRYIFENIQNCVERLSTLAIAKVAIV
jgi:hypothetical protein